MSGATPRRVKVDMHMHSERSPDSRLPVAAQARRIREAGLDVACATDHNTIEGGLRLRELADGFRVIVGAEILSRDGEIVGLFLERDVPRGLSAEETIERIRDQGGAVIVPHPFSRNRLNHIRRESLERVHARVDAIEIFNAREAFTSDNLRAAGFAAEHGLAGAVGSDSHRASEIGAAWLEMDDFTDRDGFVAALASGTVQGSLSGVVVHLWTRWDVLRKRLARRFGGEPGR
ncbi:MAG: PHP domain-containing protein [Chloroflexota bacterium]|nr:PHP domain-containing protein [Chloroflexota bacterium]MDE3192767.1 PHP domain-containing protein [Chloroflexota bacterium]